MIWPVPDKSILVKEDLRRRVFSDTVFTFL